MVSRKIYFGSILFSFIFYFLFPIKGNTQTPDPGIPGPFAVSKLQYDLGDLAFKPESFPNYIEVIGSVHYPTDLSTAPFPVLLFLHGRHSTCFKTSNPDVTQLDWPCSGSYESITSYEGYDYLAAHMASFGYIVISISANGINADDNSLGDYGMNARAELMQHHLDLWNDYNTIGGAPFDTLFIGKLDMNNIGTMGHSRGGEGAVMHALLNESLGSPYGINAVLSLAPVDFLRSVLNHIPFMNIAPYCDGDVSDLQGVHFYDDARYEVEDDEAEKFSVVMMGANHNFYNTVWTPDLYIAGTVDDWDAYHGSTVSYCGSNATDSKRLSYTEQQAAFITYASAFFRICIGNETAFLPILKVQDIIPPASSLLDSSEVFLSYHAPASQRLDIHRTENEASELINHIGGNISTNDLVEFDICADDLSEPNCDISFSQSKEPHSGSEYELGMSQLSIIYDDTTDWVEMEIPAAYFLFTNYKTLQFRAAINFEETDEDAKIDFTLRLIDSAFNVADVLVSNYTNVLFYPPGSSFYSLPKTMFHTIRIPLKDFVGVNRKRIAQIKFLFDQEDAAAILITDLALIDKIDSADLMDIDFPKDTVVQQNIFNQNAYQILLYPNPTDANIQLSFDERNPIQTIMIYTITGEIIKQIHAKIANPLLIDLQDFSEGIYIVSVKSLYDERVFQLIKTASNE